MRDIGHIPIVTFIWHGTINMSLRQTGFVVCNRVDASHNNGELIYVLDWYADDNYAKVECANNGKIGYIRKACLTLQ